MEWSEQFEPSLDFDHGVVPTVKYAICSTPRSGSHFLGQLVFATGAMGCPLEYFNRRNIVRWRARAGTESPAALMTFLQRIRTSPNGCFGLKAHFTHLKTLAQHISLQEFVDSYVHVHIVRRDLLNQAISFARARQTDVWISRAEPTDRPAIYDRSLIRQCLTDLARQNAGWTHLFHTFGLRPLLVEYEALAADPASIVRRMADHVGVELPEVKIPARPRTRRQGDDLSEHWRDRFVAEMRRDGSWSDLDALEVGSEPTRAVVPRWKRLVRAAWQG